MEERRSRHHEIKQLPLKKCGKPLLLGNLGSRVQAYLQKLRESGGAVTTQIVMAVAKAIVLHYDP